MRGALLFVVFNRPAVTARVFETIARARPPRLYVAADGPRAGHADDPARCVAAREAAARVDWPCEMRTLFQPANLGCERAVEAALEWFFAHEEEGIVLEDDMLPNPSFFAFVEELLERYRDDARVGIVGGLNLLPPRSPVARASYAFSGYFHMWGWGTWRRVWAGHDPAMADWPSARREGLIGRVLRNRRWAVRHWTRTFDATHAGATPAWDNAMQFDLWRRGLVNVIPGTNMVTNIGFGAGATHTGGEMPGFMRRAVPRDIAFPLHHPPVVAADPAFDAAIERRALRIGPVSEAKAALRAGLGWGRAIVTKP